LVKQRTKLLAPLLAKQRAKQAQMVVFFSKATLRKGGDEAGQLVLHYN